MSKLAQEVDPVLRGEAHVRAGEQWMMADEPQQAADEFTAAIEDGGPTFGNPSVYLARALFALDRDQEAEQLLAVLAANRESTTPRTCDMVAELLTEQGDLHGLADWRVPRGSRDHPPIIPAGSDIPARFSAGNTAL